MTNSCGVLHLFSERLARMISPTHTSAVFHNCFCCGYWAGKPGEAISGRNINDLFLSIFAVNGIGFGSACDGNECTDDKISH